MQYNKNVPKKTESEIQKIEKKYQSYFSVIGKRFKKLRMDDCEFSIVNMENELGIKKGSLRRFEIGEGGSIITFLNILFYFVNKGYSLDWLLTYDNSNLFKKSRDIEFVNFDKEKIAKITENSSNHIINEIYKLNNEVMNILDMKNSFYQKKHKNEEDDHSIDPNLLDGYDDIAKYMEDIEFDLKETENLKNKLKK